MRDASTPGSSPARTRIPAGAPADSPYALQLEKDFSGLKFEPVLEQEFRQVFQTESLPQIRRNLWIALVIIVGFSLMTHLVLEPPVNRLMDQIRLAMFGPIMVVGLMLVRSSLYHRYYQIACQIAAPVFGAGVAIVHVIAERHGVNLISTVVIMTIFIYFMLGMLFHAALASASLVTVAYFFAAVIGKLPAGDEGAGDVVPVGVLAGVEHGHDVRVPEVGRRLRLPEEPLDALRVVEDRGVGDLERDLAVELRVVRPVNGPERPGPELAAHDEPADPFLTCRGVRELGSGGCG